MRIALHRTILLRRLLRMIDLLDRCAREQRRAA
jgi:hypothetical protein